jgi:thiol-disulfide isomerase/thioredoxin
MMRNQNNYLLTFIYFITFVVIGSGLSNCRDENPTEFDNYLSELGFEHVEGVDVFMVIPVDICHTCIEEYKQFIKDTNNGNIRFILTGFHKKKIALTFGGDVMTKSTVVLDSKGLFYGATFGHELAQLFFMKDGRFDHRKEIHVVELTKELASLQTYLTQSEGGSDNSEAEEKLDQMLEKVLTSSLSNMSEFKDLIGREAPQFTGNLMNGKAFDLSEQRGKVVVLNFWIFGCAPCVKEIPQLNQVAWESNGSDYVIVSICAEPMDKILKSLTEDPNGVYRNINLPDNGNVDKVIKLDILPNAKEIAAEYNISSYPVTLVIDDAGIVRYTIPYTEFRMYPDQPITYKLIKLAIERTESEHPIR